MRYDNAVFGKRILHPQSEQEMRLIGGDLILLLNPGDIVLLHGKLGAGKTTLVRGAASALGYKDPVRSPTFNILQTLDTDPPVLHADLYRVGSGSGLGIEDYTATHICFVEWPDQDADWIDIKRVWNVHIEIEEAGRCITITSPLAR